MIFEPTFCDKIQAGRKTVTRRPANGRPCPHQCGSIQKVQPGQGQPALPGRMHILSVSLEKLRDVSDADAKRSGFPSRRKLLRYWGERYGGRSTQPVYRIEFEYVPAS